MTQDYEFYETAEPFTRWLFARMAQPDLRPIRGFCFEPCSGDGAIVRASSGDCEWAINDIDPRWVFSPKDATQRETWITGSAIDFTVTNPPFSQAIPILAHALACSRMGVAMYLRLSIHEPLKTGERRTFFADHKPTAVLHLPRFAHQRSRKKGIWSTDSVTSCWCVWLRGHDHQVIDYAPPSVLDDLDAFTPSYRERMDGINGLTGTEEQRQQQYRR